MTRVFSTIALFVFFFFTNAQEKKFRYEADWESIRTHYKVPDWFQNAKFGIFVIWGPHSVPAKGSEKYGKYMYSQGIQKRLGLNFYAYHKKHYGNVSDFGYKDFFTDFKMENYDPSAWAKLFKQAGAKYVVPMADYHDNYALYASKLTRWNVVETGPKKDIMQMLAKEVRKEGLKFGISSHLANARGYFPKSIPNADTNNPEYQDLYWKPIDKNSKPSQEFLDMWWGRTTEAIDMYQPDLLWFDFGIDKPGFESIHAPILAYYYNKGLDWGKEVVLQGKNMNKAKFVEGKFIHDRTVKSFPEDLIILDLERGRMNKINPSPWQTDTSVGKRSWGYVSDEDYKSSDYLIDELIDIVSKNGCLLLAVGPKADGHIDSESTKILEEIGTWLKLNGEAIYETRPWKIYGEGPTKVSAGNHSEAENKDHVAEDFRFTQNHGVLYAISLAWPEDGTFNIKSLAKGNEFESRKIRKIEFISSTQKISWKQTSHGLNIKVKGQKPCEAAYVFKINF